MSTQPRLFARTREPHKDSKHLSSENFIIVLLDTHTDDTHLRQELSRLPNCHYFRTNNIDNCLELIKSDDAADALIMLIISNGFADFIFRNLDEIVPQLSHIYLFDDVLYKQRLPSDRRFRGKFDNVQSLVHRLFSDIQEARQPKNMSKVIQYILEDNARFFWYRFFFNVLGHLQPTVTSQRVIIPAIRAILEKSPHKHSDINEFERDYQSDKIIWWYTRESFFYGLLNESLRSYDVKAIFTCQTYIQDLNRNLRKLCEEQIISKRIYLFRGRKPHIDDITKQKDNIGKLIITNCFLSTTINQHYAELFAGDSVSADSLFQPVLYRIFMDSSSTKVTGANIRHLSMYPDEEEYLFSLKSIFRIEQVEFLENRWQIDLTALDEDDQEFCAAINPWKATIGEQSFFSGRHEPIFTRYLTFENGSFLAFQLLMDLILRLDQTRFAREEMIEMCRLKYAHSPVDLLDIVKFEQKYDNKDAIEWYTTGSFLCRLLNNSLRLEDIDTLFKLRYYIYDLHNQLAQLQVSYVRSLPTDHLILTLYRGQRMKITELTKLSENISKLVSMNSFLSTTNDVQAAVFFSGEGSLDNLETEVSVLYQIIVDTSVPHSIPFAKIDYLSVYEDEDEVLFSMASVFRIDAVDQYGKLWVVDLTLIDKEDEEWNVLTAHLNE